MIWIECEHCGEDYLAERSSKKYCSNSCKTLACRKRRIEEENARIRQKMEKLIEEQFAVKERHRHDQLNAELAIQEEKWKAEKQQRDLEDQKQREIKRHEKAEKDRLAKEAKDAEYKLKKAAREAEDTRIANIIQMIAPHVINGIYNSIDRLWGNKNKENSKEEGKENTNPSSDSAHVAD